MSKRRQRQHRQAKAGGAAEEAPAARAAQGGGSEGAGQRACAERGREEAERLRSEAASVSDARSGTMTWKLKPATLSTVTTPSTITSRASWPRRASPSRTPATSERGCTARDAVQLAFAQKQQAGEHGEEAHSVEHEAGADTEGGDDDAGERGPDDARAVEQAGVERDRVRQLALPDELEGQRLPAWCVEDESDPAQGGEDEHQREGRRAGQDKSRQRGGDDHLGRLRPDEQPSCLDAVGHPARDEAEDREGKEAAEGERADGEGGVGELQDEPGKRDVLHPRSRDRDDLAGEEEPVVAVSAKAAERAPVEGQHRRRHSSLRSGSIAASTASSSSGREPVQALGEPRRPPLPHPPEQAGSGGAHDETDSPPVFGRPDAFDQALSLEPVDMTRQRRGRDALLGGELAQAQSGVLPDQPEQGHLSSCDAELLGLLAQLARKPEQHGPKLVRESEWICANNVNH